MAYLLAYPCPATVYMSVIGFMGKVIEKVAEKEI
mgnify:CR=1 FL=1